MTSYEVADLVINAATGLVVLIGLWIAIQQLRAVRKELRSNHDWNRRLTAFQYSFSDDPDMLEVLTRLDTHLKINSSPRREISVQDINNLASDEYPQIKHDIHFALARLEYMCTAMKHGVADESICRDLLENRTVSLYRFFRQHIEYIRQVRGSDKIFENLAAYATDWGKRNPSIPTRDATDI